MKRKMDKLFNTIRFDKRYVFFCLIIVIIGIICGSLFIVILNSSDKNLIIEYIESYIELIKSNNIDYLDIMKNTLIVNYIIIMIISILGFTYFFAPLNILIIFYKAFIVGFSLSSFILTYKIKGLILSILYIFPHLVFNIFLFSILTAFTLKLSLKMIGHIIKKKEVNIRAYFNKYLYTSLFVLILITVSSIYETFASVTLIKLFVNTI